MNGRVAKALRGACGGRAAMRKPRRYDPRYQNTSSFFGGVVGGRNVNLAGTPRALYQALKAEYKRRARA